MSQFGVCTSRRNAKGQPEPNPHIWASHEPHLCAQLCRDNGFDPCDHPRQVRSQTGTQGLTSLTLPGSRVNHYISATYDGVQKDQRGFHESGHTYRVDFEW
jgi:hypothetical protein